MDTQIAIDDGLVVFVTYEGTVNRDVTGDGDTTDTIIGYIDLKPPSVSVSVSPDLLWPPNHEMVDVEGTALISDVQLDADGVQVTVTSDQLDDAADAGDGDTTLDTNRGDGYLGPVPVASTLGPGGQLSFSLKLRAERAAASCRHYTVTVTARDLAGNATSATAQVKVPACEGDSHSCESPNCDPEHVE